MTDKELQKENKNPYYKLLEREDVADMIMDEFGLEKECRRIVNGHVPVKSKDGESPVRANGKLIVIDGGFAKSYRASTGVAGYTLTYNSHGLVLSANKPFVSKAEAIESGVDIRTDLILKEDVAYRKTVADTDIGKRLKVEIEDLKVLVKKI
mgnify:CR=1 FL=1